MTKHDAMKEYLEPKVQELAGSCLGFNFSSDSADSISFITSYADKVRKSYIRVGAEKEYGFTVLITKPYSMDADDLNLISMNFAQSFSDWVESQDKAKDYPDFGNRCQIKKIEALQNMPNLADVDMENGTARYMIQCRVIYFEKAR